MNVGWYRDHYSQPIYVHKDGGKLSGKSPQNYMNRTVFLNNNLREGKMTLRIHSINVFDEGQYHCFFKDGDIYEEAIVDLKVAALGLDIQINVQVFNTKEIMVECNSQGWFPQAQMKWRDSRGNVIPPLSKIFSQDEAGLLHLKTSVLLKNNTHGPVTCGFYNPVTGQEKRAGIVLPDILFQSQNMILSGAVFPLAYLSIIIALLYFRMKYIPFKQGLQKKWLRYHEIVFDCLPFLIYVSIFPVYWNLFNRVSVLDDLSPLYGTWMCDISVILSVLMAFFIILIFVLLYTLKDFLQSQASDYLSETQDT
ncbi:putative selection and upkeep of intraepithelial T-cells protein 1 homolog [Pteropus medius]|uniref:putative selection and upkeep of intraepithelial T-cells protein 1 homolog n=1 Tax=Pteropus vampyrus TaxID=132908 RepID=UPI00196A4843|nr:putative selection and upkeep of intraepithelial T-cells protein 1 homolog [Pteropus giganteus]